MPIYRKKPNSLRSAPLFDHAVSAPKGGAAYYVYASDGVRLRVAIWNNDTHENGTVFLLPGISSFIERNAHSAVDFDSFGFSTIVLDWRGHGLSDRLVKNPKIVHINKFTEYQNDIHALLETAEALQLRKPWYLVSKSMGAAIGLRAVVEGMPVEKSVFTAPMWGIQMRHADRVAALMIAKLATICGIGHLYVPGQDDTPAILKNSFGTNDFTSDQSIFTNLQSLANKYPELHTGGPSLGWLSAAMAECRKLRRLQNPKIPGLVISAECDTTVQLKPAIDRTKAWPTGDLYLVANAKHDLMTENSEIRSHVLSLITKFLAKTSGKHNPN